MSTNSPIPAKSGDGDEPVALVKPTRDTPLFEVVRLLRPQGRRGELLSESLSDLPGLLKAGKTLYRSSPSEGPIAVTLEEVWRPQGRNAGRLVLKLSGVASISAAETWQNVVLSLPESELPAREPDTFLVRDLLGCTLFNGAEPVGTIVDLQYALAPDGHTRLPDAADLLGVERPGAPGSEPLLIPFVKAWLLDVDLEAKRITMQLPSGLLDPDEPS